MNAMAKKVDADDAVLDKLEIDIDGRSVNSSRSVSPQRLISVLSDGHETFRGVGRMGQAVNICDRAEELNREPL